MQVKNTTVIFCLSVLAQKQSKKIRLKGFLPYFPLPFINLDGQQVIAIYANPFPCTTFYLSTIGNQADDRATDKRVLKTQFKI